MRTAASHSPVSLGGCQPDLRCQVTTTAVSGFALATTRSFCLAVAFDSHARRYSLSLKECPALLHAADCRCAKQTHEARSDSAATAEVMPTPLDLWVESLLWRPGLAVEGPDELVCKQVAVSCCCEEEACDGSICSTATHHSSTFTGC